MVGVGVADCRNVGTCYTNNEEVIVSLSLCSYLHYCFRSEIKEIEPENTCDKTDEKTRKSRGSCKTAASFRNVFVCCALIEKEERVVGK